MLPDTFIVLFIATYDKLLALGERVKGRHYSASEFTRLIRRQFPATDFVFKTYRDYAVDPDTVIVAGLYDVWDDQQYLPSITVTLCYHPEQDCYFVDLLNWQQFSFDLAECIGHELVHRDQQKNGRKPLLKPYKSKHTVPAVQQEQQYLGDESEIEAYGFSIAAECMIFKKTIQECAMHQAYVEMFDNDTAIVLKLEQQVERYLKRMEHINEQVNN
jgi:hypothetical protein